MSTSDNQTAVLEPTTVRPLHQNRSHAVGYTDRGWAIHPLAPNTKKPLKGSRGLHDATHDRDVLREVFVQADLNVGIRTGEISNLVVVDIDCHDDAANGYDSLKEMARQGFKIPTGNHRRGCGIAITPSGGMHLYFTLREGDKLKNSSGLIAPGIDIRAEGGYVVAPPSKTEDGSYYWVQYPEQLSPIPEWLAEKCRATPVLERPAHQVRPTADIPPRVADTIKDRLDRIATAAPGQRNHTLNREAFYLAQFVGKGFGVDDLDGWLLDAALRSDMPQYEARRTIDSALSQLGGRRSSTTSRMAPPMVPPKGWTSPSRRLRGS